MADQPKRYRTAGLGELPACAHWGAPDVVLASDYDAQSLELANARAHTKLDMAMLAEVRAELQAVREALRQIAELNPDDGATACDIADAALKPSRGAE